MVKPCSKLLWSQGKFNLTVFSRAKTSKGDNQNNKLGLLVHVLGKDKCDERDDKRDERDERENFWLHISCFVSFSRLL